VSSVNKLKIDSKKKISMAKTKVFTENLWFCGKKVGEING